MEVITNENINQKNIDLNTKFRKKNVPYEDLFFMI